jgi:hypothetical protein
MTKLFYALRVARSMLQLFGKNIVWRYREHRRKLTLIDILNLEFERRQ